MSLISLRELTEELIAKDETSKADMQIFFETSLDLFCLAGKNGYFKKINPSWIKTFGYTEEELLSKPFIEFVHPNDKEKTLVTLNTLKPDMAIQYFRNRFCKKDGLYITLCWNIRMTKNNLLCAVARNYTEMEDAHAG
jgi:PAS domain S-box-containing protein